MKARREPDRVLGAHPLLTELKEARRDRTERRNLTHDAHGEIAGARPDDGLQQADSVHFAVRRLVP